MSPCSWLAASFGEQTLCSAVGVGTGTQVWCQDDPLGCLHVSVETLGDRVGPGADVPSLCPIPWAGSLGHSSLMLGPTPASCPAGQGWPTAASSCRCWVWGTWAPILLAEHMLCHAALSLSRVLGCWGGLGEAGVGHHQLKAAPEQPAGRLSHTWVLSGHQGAAEATQSAWAADFAPTA